MLTFIGYGNLVYGLGMGLGGLFGGWRKQSYPVQTTLLSQVSRDEIKFADPEPRTKTNGSFSQ